MSAATIDHDHLRDALADGLQRLSGKAWMRADDGTLGTEGWSLAVFVADLHGNQEPGHVDIGVALNPKMPEAPTLWDCTAGVGHTPAEVAERAAYVWLQTTAPTILEFLEHQGRLAAHLGSDDPDGLPAAGLGRRQHRAARAA